ncbi:hypothetical protein ASE53_33385 [Bacillus sp. Root11]|jgi:hypothetical protein|uniref:Uncharacterized protein n=3 Tax=Bacillus thuringiensis TaxID=1428 RepID=A0A9X6M6W9_BACTJ|nr:hypothetical protein BTF1_31881 [Bacillus thuringiensis HD-789]AJH03462.1 putative transposase [Bacillus thuringiensis HD1002]AND28756.1 hypothetical protein ATN07_34180 [Bacillus thuringiensis serovar israelensis]KQB18085.1 hypothetical protein AL712_31630 [Bacillus thuringiensis]KRD82143.1 hypothetical protein ASE53_33385 [Bacillus sp. Root11]OUB64483.1 hypothetical protein BK750_17735 [Bacillus thuringiensis serovar jegathesan]RCX34244.1 hypothetical protein DEU45_1445 [Bacillus sp. AG1
MSNPYNRHDVTDENWNKLEPSLPIYLGNGAVVTPTVIVYLLMSVYGLFVQVLHGMICQMDTGNLTVHTVAISDGVLKEFGINSLQS